MNRKHAFTIDRAQASVEEARATLNSTEDTTTALFAARTLNYNTAKRQRERIAYKNGNKHRTPSGRAVRL